MTKTIPINAALWTLAGIALATPGQAWAQASPDIQDAITAGTQIEDALREQERAQIQPGAAGDEEIDGEAGVYVLAVNDIFYLGASVGGGWSENPTRTIDNPGDAVFASAAATLGIQTQLGGEFDAGLSVSASGVEYDKSFAPSSRTVTFAGNLGHAIEGTPFYVGITGFGGWTYDNAFNNATSFYGGNAALSARFRFGQRTQLRTTLAGGRQMGDITENNSWNANLSFDLSHAVSPNLFVGTSGRVSRVWFDDFYEDVTFVARNDWQYGGNLNATWAPASWLSLTGSAGYEKRDSGFFLSSYDGFEASLIISARTRF